MQAAQRLEVAHRPSIDLNLGIATFLNGVAVSTLQLDTGTIADTIHFGISYKAAVRIFVRTYRLKYLSKRVFGAVFAAIKDFHIVARSSQCQATPCATMDAYEITPRHGAP